MGGVRIEANKSGITSHAREGFPKHDAMNPKLSAASAHAHRPVRRSFIATRDGRIDHNTMAETEPTKTIATKKESVAPPGECPLEARVAL
jgi:hypothetical protein